MKVAGDFYYIAGQGNIYTLPDFKRYGETKRT